MTVRVESDLPITDRTFSEKFRKFEIADPGGDLVVWRHHFDIPDARSLSLGEQVYRTPPWAIFRRNGGWAYLGIMPEGLPPVFHRLALFDDGHARGEIYNPGEERFRDGGLPSLTLFPTDQIVLARVLADRQACYMHAAGMIIDGKGFLFVGHSEAGKSTTVTMLREQGEILCDDRIVVRRWPEGFRIHGTWSHGDVPDVSPNSALLRAVVFLEQADENRILPIADTKALVRKLPFYVIKPLVTADWWEKTLDLLGAIAREVPAYRMRFDKSGRIIDALRGL